MTRALVTGCAGFIGSHLVDRLLSEGYMVYGVDDLSTGNRKNLPLANGRFCFLQSNVVDFWTENIDVDIIFHLAARADIVPSITKPDDYHRVNVDGTFRMLEYARKNRVRKFVYAASSSCYGKSAPTPTKERDPKNPAYPYALTKYIGEQYVMHWAKVYNIPSVSLRLFNVYGPRHRTNGAYGAVFGVFLAQLANGKPLTVVGDGKQRRDFIFVSDVVDAFMKAAQSDATGIYNIGTGRPRAINELVNLLGATEIVNLPERPGEPSVTHANINSARICLGWSPKIEFEDGVKIMKGIANEWKEAPIWTPQAINEVTREWFQQLS